MCEYYGLPLALISEELIDMDKPENKAQEQRPAEAKREQQNKGERQKSPGYRHSRFVRAFHQPAVCVLGTRMPG